MKKFDPQVQVVIMCGISGSGKTHFARQLEQQGFKRLSTDSLIWNKVGEDLYKLSRDEQKSLFAECGKEMRMQLKDMLKAGKRVVVDATHCKRHIRDEIRFLCREEGVLPFFLYCHADKEELWNRLSKRRGSGPDDLIITAEEFSEYLQGFEPPEEDEKDIKDIRLYSESEPEL